MRAAILGVDVFSEGEDILGVVVVVLDRDLERKAFAFLLHVDGFLMQHRLTAIEVLDELRDAAIEFEFRALGFAGLGIRGALIGKRDGQTFVEEGELTQTIRQSVKAIFGDGKDLAIRKKVDLGATLLGAARLLEFCLRFAFGVSLLVNRAGFAWLLRAPDLKVQLIAKRVHHAHAYSVQTARDFVSVGIKLAAGMQ